MGVLRNVSIKLASISTPTLVALGISQLLLMYFAFAVVLPAIRAEVSDEKFELVDAYLIRPPSVTFANLEALGVRGRGLYLQLAAADVLIPAVYAPLFGTIVARSWGVDAVPKKQGVDGGALLDMLRHAMTCGGKHLGMSPSCAPYHVHCTLKVETVVGLTLSTDVYCREPGLGAAAPSGGDRCRRLCEPVHAVPHVAAAALRRGSDMGENCSHVCEVRSDEHVPAAHASGLADEPKARQEGGNILESAIAGQCRRSAVICVLHVEPLRSNA